MIRESQRALELNPALESPHAYMSRAFYYLGLLQQAEQVTREVAATRPGLHVADVQVVELEARPVVLVSIESSREPKAEDVSRFETLLQERLGEPTLRVVVRRNDTTDITSKGAILLGDAHFGAATPEAEARREAAEAAVRSAITAIPNQLPCRAAS